MTLTVCVATMSNEEYPGYSKTLMDTAVTSPGIVVRRNGGITSRNLGVVGSYEWLYQYIHETATADVLAYIHDDTECFETGWDQRVIAEFADPKVGIVGFGGALGHGVPDLYKTRFEIPQLIRYGYRSNDRNAEQHGERFTGSCNSVFVDGFALCIRREFLDKINGWSQLIGNVDFIGYDMAICALARRHGYKIRVVGIDCWHKGGGTSVAQNADRQAEYDSAHAWFAKHFSDVLPARVDP